MISNLNLFIGFGKENPRKPEAIGTKVYYAVKFDLPVSIMCSAKHFSGVIFMQIKITSIKPSMTSR